MSLKKYHAKRNFAQTPEPFGKVKKTSTKPLYIIQKHAASHLHYDFRLELDGVLKSWAVPKGPSLDPTIKRLAVHVEDHPLEYGTFEGIIPAGEYGGGTVMLWDQGSWEMPQDAMKDYKKGHLKFGLKGKKLKGQWKLIQISGDAKNWLLIKGEDQYAKTDVDITELKNKSVVSNKTMEQIASNTKKKVWSSKDKKKGPQKSKIIVSDLPNANKTKFPKTFKPQLATLVANAPEDDQWLHEVKFDGYRLIALIRAGEVVLFTRNNNDWTKKFSKIQQALTNLSLPDCILDGEIVALDSHRHSDFQQLQNQMRDEETNDLYYYIFDIAYCQGFDVTKCPLIERKKLLASLLPKKHASIHYSDHIIGSGPDVFKNASKMNLEGIISKRIDSQYVQKRSKNWLKVKCMRRQEFFVVGFTKPRGSRENFGSLLLGVYDKKKTLHYAGHVGTGFTVKSLQEIAQKLKKLHTSARPFTHSVPGIKQVTWVEPKMVVEVEFYEWTTEGILRHPSFKGIRLDKKPLQIIKEVVQPLKKLRTKS